MKKLLEIFLRHFEFLYADPRYRFTDSRTHAPNASLTVSGPDVTWWITLDRGQLELSVAPTRLPGDSYWISLIRQYVRGDDDIRYLSAADEIDWARENVEQIERLFSEASDVEAVTHTLAGLRRENGEKRWGPAAST
ncbi:hypothetical protein H7I41_15150 [Mycobacterium manitobense]|uniref:Uncharacterized protein n=1 Tax=[Mycobacterium] manitobense TaxID=190147 RepID=A0A9X2YPW9_9MYCO|nr:hypothetical protein [[Mycobacterium] manitobense]MCV7171251.1 hypothetical protein [[Mycobacterium] manitobense]